MSDDDDDDWSQFEQSEEQPEKCCKFFSPAITNKLLLMSKRQLPLTLK